MQMGRSLKYQKIEKYFVGYNFQSFCLKKLVVMSQISVNIVKS
jgi:hypothetical protein